MSRVGLNHRARFYAARNPHARSVSLYLHIKEFASPDLAAAPVVFRVAEPLNALPEPFLEVPEDVAQQLMDELWIAGFRPTEGTGSAGALAATQAHVKDLQDIVSRVLGIVERGGKE